MCGYQLVYNALQPCFVKCMYSAVGHLYKQGSTSPTSGVKRLDKQNRHGLAVAVPACWNRMLQLTYKYCSNNVLRPSAGDMAAPYPVPEDPKTTRKSLGQFWKDTRQARRDNPQDKSLVAPGLQQYQGAVTWPQSGRPMHATLQQAVKKQPFSGTRAWLTPRIVAGLCCLFLLIPIAAAVIGDRILQVKDPDYVPTRCERLRGYHRSQHARSLAQCCYLLEYSCQSLPSSHALHALHTYARVDGACGPTCRRCTCCMWRTP